MRRKSTSKGETLHVGECAPIAEQHNGYDFLDDKTANAKSRLHIETESIDL